MTTVRAYQRQATARDYRFFRDPRLWPLRPFLPVVRRPAGAAEPELGLMYDARASDLYGLSATVFFTNYFLVPATQAEFLALPRCVYDTFDELAADGWTVD